MKPILFILSLLMFWSCQKDELPKPKGNYELNSIRTLALGDTYRNQIGFSLQNEIENSLDMMDWDFYIYPDKSIRLNTARFMKVLPVNSDFQDELIDSNFKYDTYSNDLPDFKLKCTETESYWVLDLGRDEEGEVLEKYDLSVKYIADLFIMKFRIHGTSIWKTVEFNTSSELGEFYSILNERQFENPMFTNSEFYIGGYMTRFETEGLDYLVRGILSNTNQKLEFYKSNTLQYSELKLSDIQAETFSKQLNNIGFDWKTYDIDKGLYTVDSDMIYIIKYPNGLYYKFRFIGFYNDLGEKGFPKIEYGLLE